VSLSRLMVLTVAAHALLGVVLVTTAMRAGPR